MKSPARFVSLATLLGTLSLSSGFLFIPSQIAFANTSASPDSVGARLEKVSSEIESLKGDTETTLKSIHELQDTNRCLGVVYSGLTNLSEQLNAMGQRGTVGSISNRTGVLVKKHAEFFESLNEFSKQTLILIGNHDLSRASSSEELSRTVNKASELIQNLRQQYQAQAEDEVKFLAEVSSSIQRLQRAGIATKRSLESAKQCAPHLVEKNSNLIDLGLKVLNNLDKARSLIAELQLKRSRILGALTSSLQKKLASQLAEASGQKSDALVTQMNASLAELNLRTEIEQWWFTEGIEKGPARGFLAGPQENGLKASEILRLAIASCDVFIARVKEAHSSPAFNEKMKEKAAHSALEISLYQRREALGRWLEQANRSSTITAR
jgi:hypothetical protein